MRGVLVVGRRGAFWACSRSLNGWSCFRFYCKIFHRGAVRENAPPSLSLDKECTSFDLLPACWGKLACQMCQRHFRYMLQMDRTRASLRRRNIQGSFYTGCRRSLSFSPRRVRQFGNLDIVSYALLAMFEVLISSLSKRSLLTLFCCRCFRS